jgi:hypothetical protein
MLSLLRLCLLSLYFVFYAKTSDTEISPAKKLKNGTAGGGTQMLYNAQKLKFKY